MSPGKLVSLLRERLEAACHGHPPVSRQTEGDKGRLEVRCRKDPGREISTYIAALDHAVVLTNSPVQLERVLQTARNRSFRLAEAPEYRFFRTRYPRGADGETALLILTDATIRHWCGPDGESPHRGECAPPRRSRSIQAANLARSRRRRALTTLQCPTASPSSSVPHLGELRISRTGIPSLLYGTLGFQTPIVEIPLDEVTEAEAQAYDAWRQLPEKLARHP